MRTTVALGRLFLPLVVYLLVVTLCARAAGPEQDIYEEKVIGQAVERAVERMRWVSKTDRALWVKEMEAAFPGKAGSPTKDEEYAAWFKLLAGEADEWRRDGTADKGLAELFDRTTRQMGLGPVPSIKKDEFMRYARNVLAQGNLQTAIDTKNEADRMFRILDRDSDGVLSPDEFTTKLRDDRAKADADGNGRIDKEEYRESYHRRVTEAAEVLAKGVGAGGKANATGWPADLDTDKDGQIALHEWRKGGRPLAQFVEMDLDGDGLLTQDEYRRHMQMKEVKKDDDPDAARPAGGGSW